MYNAFMSNNPNCKLRQKEGHIKLTDVAGTGKKIDIRSIAMAARNVEECKERSDHRAEQREEHADIGGRATAQRNRIPPGPAPDPELNPGAGTFYIWLLPILLPELRHIRFVVSLTHCFKGGTGWRKYTSILTNDGTLASRVGPCGSCPHANCGHSRRHEVIIGGHGRLPPGALNMKHSAPPALYDAELFHLLLEIPPDQRHRYAIVHMGSGSQSSTHISCHGFVVLTVDKEPTTNTKFRSVSPTLNIDYDSRPIMGIVAIVAAKAGFHVDAVVGILFNPCCITRTTMTRMNRNHRYSNGQPFSAPAYTHDVFDTAHILHFDYAV